MNTHKNILITGVGGDIGQSIIRCLKENGYKDYLFGCDIDPYAGGKEEVTKFVIAPQAAEAKAYSKFMSTIIEKYRIKYIYPTTEQEIIFFDRKRENFVRKGVTVFINHSFILKTFLDKYKTVIFLKQNKLPYPATFLIEKYSNQLNFPLIIKPRRSCGSREVIQVNSSEKLEFYKNILKDAIVQEYLGQDDGEEYTTGVFSDGTNVHSITFRRKIGFGGLSKLVELVEDTRISRLAERIAQCCNLVGSINIQTRKTPKGFVVFEINPRFSSTVYFRDYFGFQDVKWWLDLKEKRNIKFKLKYKKGIGVRILSETFFELE